RPIPTPRERMKAKASAVLPPSAIAAPLEPPDDRLPPESQRTRAWALAQPEREWSAESMARWRQAPQDGTLGALPLLVLTRARGGYGEGLGVPAAELESE